MTQFPNQKLQYAITDLNAITNAIIQTSLQLNLYICSTDTYISSLICNSSGHLIPQCTVYKAENPTTCNYNRKSNQQTPLYTHLCTALNPNHNHKNPNHNHKFFLQPTNAIFAGRTLMHEISLTLKLHKHVDFKIVYRSTFIIRQNDQTDKS